LGKAETKRGNRSGERNREWETERRKRKRKVAYKKLRKKTEMEMEKESGQCKGGKRWMKKEENKREFEMSSRNGIRK